jgi:ABC-2 type transport system permease protein
VLVSVNPVSHLANASRGLMHGDVRMSDIVYVLIATAVITAVFAPIALRMYHRER